MQILSRRQTHEEVAYARHFEWRDRPGSGFSFDCDEHGHLLAPYENYEKCVNGTYDVVDQGIQKREWSWVEPTVGLCECGQEVSLERFTNTCNCGRDYNMSGQELAPRCQWGEETGESLADILRIP